MNNLWVYFVLIDKDSIKIGKTRNVARRILQYEKNELTTHKVELIAAVEGAGSDEKDVQRYFAEDAVSSQLPRNNQPPELFHITLRLTNYIRWLRNQWFVAVDMEDVPERCVTFESWEPTNARQVQPPWEPLFENAEPNLLDFFGRKVTRDDFYTNPKIIEVARTVLGTIDLDPASHAKANKIVKASVFYTKSENGLTRQWKGNVWLNPPFSDWQLWVPKVINEMQSGRVLQMCIYAAMRTITARYFRRFLNITDAMCVVTGRMKHGGKGEDPEKDSPNDGHAIFYCGKNISLFTDRFSAIGKVYRT